MSGDSQVNGKGKHSRDTNAKAQVTAAAQCDRHAALVERHSADRNIHQHHVRRNIDQGKKCQCCQIVAVLSWSEVTRCEDVSEPVEDYRTDASTCNSRSVEPNERGDRGLRMLAARSRV